MAYTDSSSDNYRGELMLVGAYQTPFLSMMGGMGGGSRSNSFLFPLAQTYGLTAASQPTITETVSAAAGTATTITRSEDTNTAQIFKEDVAATFKKQSQFGLMAGINTNDANPVVSELGFQKAGALKQMAIDMEWSFLQGTYNASSGVTDAAGTRGIYTASVAGSNTEDGGAATLTKELVDKLLLDMATNGAVFDNSVIFVNGFQKQVLSDIYGYAPADRNVGGVNISTIETDFARLGIVYAPNMPAAGLLIADMAHVQPVFVPVSFSGEGVADSANGADVLWVPTAITAAKAGGFFYSQAGIDYGPEEYHGTITGLATS